MHEHIIHWPKLIMSKYKHPLPFSVRTIRFDFAAVTYDFSLQSHKLKLSIKSVKWSKFKFTLISSEVRNLD